MNRRAFFSRMVSLTGLFVVSSWSMAWAERGRGGGAAAGDAGGAGKAKMVDPNSPVAKAVNYVENRSSVKEATLKVDRQGVPFAKQECKNCGFYSKPETAGGKEIGGCQLFAGQSVKSDAWCASWNKKA